MPDIKGKLGQPDSRTAGQPDSRTAGPLLFARIRETLKSIPFIYYPVHYAHLALIGIGSVLSYIEAFIKWQLYKHTVRFNRNGLNTTESRPRRIIVSLTSYPARINVVPYVIASILNQTMKPDKIILWLGKDRFPDEKLPTVFSKLKACGVDVQFREDVGPHTKYFYAFKEYPEDIVITFDDDIVYRPHIIGQLYESYLKHPECVSAIRVNKLTVTPCGDLPPYSCCTPQYKNHAGHKSHLYFATGVGGVLYPPHSVHPDVFNVEAIMLLSPKADDVWLKFMEVINGTRVAAASNESNVQGWVVFGSQEYALSKSNVFGMKNDVQFRAVIDAYADWRDSKGRTIQDVIREG